LKKILFILFFIPVAAFSANISIDTGSSRALISPLIYGTNQQMDGTENLTVLRLGGNRMTAYNWENNASNAGSDWYHSSDNFMCGAIENPVNASDCANVPGAVLNNFIDYCILRNYEPIITLPMAGYVAADKNGNVLESEAAPSSRWKAAVSKKGSAFSLPPNTADNYVYADEEVAHIVNRYGAAGTANGVRFYELDNEADLWNSTHVRIHPSPVGAYEWVTRGAELSKAIKDVDANAQVMGPVFFGVWSMMSQGTDWNSVRGSNNWYVPYYLQEMKALSDADGRRLLDVLDIHYYSEAREGLYPPFNYSSGQCRITEDSCTSAAAQQARLQAPRSLWDPAYRENSSVGEWCGTALPIIPKVQAAIDAKFPGTKIAFTEHGFGGGNDFSGGLAVADVLGIFGKYNVYIATMWKTAYGPFHSAAYKLFRNYDGLNSVYGDTKVYCESSDVPNMTAYAAINGTDVNTLHVIVINKSASAQNADFSITSSATYQSGEAYGFGGAQSAVTLRAAPVITGNNFSYNIPAYSAYHFVFHGTTGPTYTPTSSVTPGGPTLTYTPSSTGTYTSTHTPTPGPGYVIYDGDTAGKTITAGTVSNSADGGGITETAGGNGANGMTVNFANVQSWWQQHAWTLNTPVNTASYTTIEFDVKSASGTPGDFQLGLDWTLATWTVDVETYTAGGVIDTSWRHVTIPLDTLLQGGTVIERLIFAASTNTSYGFMIDNVKISGTAATTSTPTYTYTNTNTSTATRTFTLLPSYTATATSTNTIAATHTFTGTSTLVNTFTYTVTPAGTSTFTNTAQFTNTYTNTATDTYTPFFTFTNTPVLPATITHTNTFTRTATATKTQMQTHTHTVTAVYTSTFTNTPQAAYTETPAATQQESDSDKLEIKDFEFAPNPYNSGNLLISFTVNKSTGNVKFRLYTGSFRLIREINLKLTPGAGVKTFNIPETKIGNLANGTYYPVLLAEGGSQKAISGIKTLVVIRAKTK